MNITEEGRRQSSEVQWILSMHKALGLILNTHINTHMYWLSECDKAKTNDSNVQSYQKTKVNNTHWSQNINTKSCFSLEGHIFHFSIS